MEELIKIKTRNDKQLVSARDLHRGLELKKKFSAWIKQNLDSFEEGTDYTWEPQSYHVQIGNGATRVEDDCLLTLDTAKELCMISKTEKGKEVREYFIQVEKNWNSPDMIIQRALAISESRVKLLQSRNEQLSDHNKELQDKIDKDADDVVFAKAIRYGHRSISVRELAEILTENGFVIGQNQLYSLLRKTKYISKFSTLPMTDKVKNGYFRVVHKVARSGQPYSKTLVTPKGQKHIINKALRGKFDDAYQHIVTTTLNI